MNEQPESLSDSLDEDDCEDDDEDEEEVQVRRCAKMRASSLSRSASRSNSPEPVRSGKGRGKRRSSPAYSERSGKRSLSSSRSRSPSPRRGRRKGGKGVMPTLSHKVEKLHLKEEEVELLKQQEFQLEEKLPDNSLLVRQPKLVSQSIIKVEKEKAKVELELPKIFDLSACFVAH
eukprot:CAMPEP_0114601788 /NCGR_PEP_ID=MMETSP0125-20121206/24402_1 /TAXON_ID=485358 ORGANISM="Aristerostoma sp., Strain ATCC 50986" /NCGR_SAMPLE_ID=MMETSP0125 /ASSEMBLY_ACC=CAM_ASM_000245 /LENGTH=174 /DNA_ID=CAMNT_0001811357 /DNA_START=1055 /DNA_END=1576 /DNA_ORIENTATION=-